MITQVLSRFFWCFREACACLRHYPKCRSQIDRWLRKATDWMRIVGAAIGDPATTTPNRFRVEDDHATAKTARTTR